MKKNNAYCFSSVNSDERETPNCIVGLTQLKYESGKKRGIICAITGDSIEKAPCIKAIMARNKRLKIW